jgi:histidine triad (HIT) family protein
VILPVAGQVTDRVPPVVPDCRFCAIARGEGDAKVVLEDDDVLAFLDHRPLFPGHCLVIPREHHETLPDLPLEMLAPLFAATRLLAEGVVEALDAEGSFVAVNNVVSQSVPHLHVHVVPRRRKDGLRGFFWPRTPYRDESHANEVRDALRRAVARARTA